jgi:uncharacterized protein YndB with AHSA1/START domain
VPLRYDIRLEKVFAASPVKVWRALTDSDVLSRWLMKNDFIAQQGQSFTFRAKASFGWDGIVHCKVLEITPLEHLTISWVGAPDMPETQVSWWLAQVGGGTKLVFSHTGFRGLKYSIIGRFLERGWTDMIDRRLSAVLAEE